MEKRRVNFVQDGTSAVQKLGKRVTAYKPKKGNVVNFHQLTNNVANNHHNQRYAIRVHVNAHGCLRPSGPRFNGEFQLMTFSAPEGLEMWDRKWTRVQQVGGSYQDMVLSFHREGHCDQGLATSVIVYVGGEKSTRLPLKRYVLDVFGRQQMPACPTIRSKHPTKQIRLSILLYAKATALSLLKKAMDRKAFKVLTESYFSPQTHVCDRVPQGSRDNRFRCQEGARRRTTGDEVG